MNEQIRYIHRTSGEDDIYFVASAFPEAKRFLCTFRVKGKPPELWWPDTGRIEPIAVYEERGDTTVVPLALDPFGSVFVVFRGGDPRGRTRWFPSGAMAWRFPASLPALPDIQLQHEPADVTLAAAGYHLEARRQGITN